MALQTQGVYDLARDVLQSVPKPYGEDIIEDVCLAIEQNAAWLARYEALCGAQRKQVVNNWIGQYVKKIVGMDTIHQVDAARSRIIGSYSKLKPKPA